MVSACFPAYCSLRNNPITTTHTWKGRLHFYEVHTILSQQVHSHLEILPNYTLSDEYFQMFSISNPSGQWSCFTEKTRVIHNQIPEHPFSLSQNDAVSTYVLLLPSKPLHLPYLLLPERRIPPQVWPQTVLFPITNTSSVPVCPWASVLVFPLPRMPSFSFISTIFLRQTNMLNLLNCLFMIPFLCTDLILSMFLFPYLVDPWVHELLIHISYTLAVKKKTILPFVTVWWTWRNYAKWNKPIRERQIPHDFTHMWNLRTELTRKIGTDSWNGWRPDDS